MKYTEGDWFAVPLRDGGFGVGVIARANPGGVLLGYFFGPERDSPPSLVEVSVLEPTDAVMVRKFGHLGIAQGEWPIIGHVSSWDRSDWPMPAFVRYEELSGRSFRIFYDDDDPNKLVREEHVDAGEDEQGPKDGLLGAGAVEKVLTTQLR